MSSIAHLPDSLYTLRPALFKLAVWLYTHYAGEAVELSHREIAAAVRLSESTVSDGMAELATLGIIARTWDRGRYLVSVPGDRGLPEGIADYGSGSLSDPTEAGDRSAIPPAAPGSRTRQTRAGDRQSIPPAHKEVLDQEEEILDHDQESPPTPRARELLAQLVADGVKPSPAAEVLAGRPDLTPELWAAELAAMKARGKGLGYLVNTLKAGSTLVLPAAAGDAPIDPDAISYGDAYRRGDDLEGLDPRLLRYLGQGVTHAA